MAYKGWYAIKPKQPTNQPTFITGSFHWSLSDSKSPHLSRVLQSSQSQQCCDLDSFNSLISCSPCLFFVPYSQLTLCAKWTYNVHYYRIYKERRNLEIRKHVTISCSGTKPFYKLRVKGFDVRRRDTIFYAVLFIWPPTRAAPLGRKFASRLRTPKVDPSRLASSTRLFLSSNSPTTSARFQYRLGLLWHLSDTSIRPPARARAHPR